MPTNGSQKITEGGLRLGILSRLLDRNLAIGMQGISQQSDQAVESQQAWRTAFNGQVRPLPLGFDSQMRPTLFVGHFQTPPFDEIFHNLHSGLPLVRREVGFGCPFALRIPCQDESEWGEEPFLWNTRAPCLW